MTGDEQLELLYKALHILRHYRNRVHIPHEMVPGADIEWYDVRTAVNADAAHEADRIITRAKQLGMLEAQDRYR